MTAMINFGGATIRGGPGGIGIDGGLGGRGGDVNIYVPSDPREKIQEVLKPVPGVGLIEHKACLPGTRIHTLERVTNWIDNPTSSPILFILGGAGTGKSAIAHSIGRHYKAKGQLGSFFCFNRSSEAGRGPDTLFRTIACNLSDWNYSLGKAVADKIYAEGSNFNIADLTAQWHLVLDAAKQFNDLALLVVDALDESGPPELEARQHLLYFLTECSAALPMNFRIVITSRPESDIMHAITTYLPVGNCIDLSEMQEEAKSDIGIYIRYHFKASSSEIGDLPDDYYQLLVDKADGLFQWAFTVCKWILGTENRMLTLQERFDQLFNTGNVSNTHTERLNDLYSSILSQAFDFSNPRALERFQAVMAHILSAAEPLSIGSLNKLCQLSNSLSKDDISLVMRHLGSLLIGVRSLDVPIQPYHTSFRDFLTTKSCSRDWYIEVNNGHSHMAVACLRIMNQELHFNMANVKSSFLSNTDIKKTKYSIHKALEYACRFWTYHLGENIEAILLQEVDVFVKGKILFWLEVLSISFAVNTAGTMLESLSNALVSKTNEKQNTSSSWFSKIFYSLDFTRTDTLPNTDAEKPNNQRADLEILVEDAIRFVQYFGPAIAHSAPHIYVSVLPFAPKSSQIAKIYSARLKNILVLKIGKLSQWPAKQALLAGHTNAVTSVAFSPDGKHIVSGSEDKTIQIWDANTGQTIGRPLKGHTRHVTSVAFSSDGNHIISGSQDRTVRIWDAKKGQTIGKPLKGHRDYVSSVGFSSDGRHIVSGSWDSTVQIWDAKTGQAIGNPLNGHADYITSVTFSPDGKHIASGSADRTIQIWNAKTYKPLGKPLKGHIKGVTSIAWSPDSKYIVSSYEDSIVLIWDAKKGTIVGKPLERETYWVTSVAFSPDGQYIISGSRDGTLQIWDAKTGQTIGNELKGHIQRVNSVAFSPDGKHFVSGSQEKTIQIWDAKIGHSLQSAQKPWQGHRSAVTSVAFSIDSKYIVSGCLDHTVQIWDTRSGQTVGELLEGHTKMVTSVAFSPDGRYIASGSEDRTIQIWDAKTGQTVGKPLKGHINGVTSISFSPDGSYIASGSNDKIILIWETKTGQTVGKSLIGHTKGITSVKFSPDGKHVASGSQDKTIQIWDVKTGKTVGKPLKGHTDYVASVAFSPDGELIISGSWDRTVRIWNIKTSQTVGNPLEGHTGWVNSVAFSPDGTYIISGSDDQTILIWETKTGQTIGKPLKGHVEEISSVAFSLDGKHIVSGSVDHTIRIWDTAIVLNYGRPLLHESKNIGSTSVVNLIQSPAERSHSDLVNQFSLDQDGWARGPGNELLFWVPGIHRQSFHVPGTIKATGQYETALDFSHVTWGTNWTECWNKNV